MIDNLFDGMRDAVKNPERVLFGGQLGSMYTYASAFEQVGRFANAFVSMALAPGDRVAVLTDKSPEAVLLYLACLRAGLIYVPINPDYSEPERRHILQDARPKLVICRQPERSSVRQCLVGELSCSIETLDATGEGSIVEVSAHKPAAFREPPRDRGDAALLLYTSGTTGRPKGALLTHGNLLSNAIALRGLWEFHASDVLLHALPIFHTHGLCVAINVAMLANSRIVLVKKFDVEFIATNIASATVFMGVPTFYRRLLDYPGLERKALRNLRLFTCGSAPLSKDLFDEFAERFGQRILERYGMTETNMICSNPYVGERRRGSVGFPLPDVDVRIVCESGNDDGDMRGAAVGMIQVKGPSVFPGYWGKPEVSAKSFSDDGYFITGDLGYKDDDGYIHLVGRKTDVVITGGMNVYPAEVENAINALPGVKECAVIGVPDSDYGEAVTAFVVNANGELNSTDDVVRKLRHSLAPYKIPKCIIAIDQLPKNAMGKIVKSELRRRIAESAEVT